MELEQQAADRMKVKLLYSTTLTALMIAVALLHSSLGQFLQVSHIEDMPGKVLLECLDESGIIQSGATYTFKDPEGRVESSAVAEGTSYEATILRTNESLVTCTLENMPGVESQPVKVVGTSSNRYYK
jgi:hypothetical protein